MMRVVKHWIRWPGLLGLGVALLLSGGAEGARAQSGAQPGLQAQASPAGPISEQPIEAGAAGGEAASQIQAIQAENQNGQVTIRVQATGALQYTAFKLTDPLRLVLDFQNMGPSTVAGPIQVNQGVVGAIRSLYFDEAGVQRLEIGLTSTAAYEIKKPSANLLLIQLQGSAPKMAQVPAQGMPPAMPPAADASQKSTPDPCQVFLSKMNQTVSAEFVEAELPNIFRFLSEIGQVNLVVSSTIQGKASLKVENVPWRQAVELLNNNYGLGMDCKSDIIRVTSVQELLEERFSQPMVTQLVRLNYSDSDAVINNLKSLSSPQGRAVSDKRTNSIIISDTEQVIDDMMEVIRNLDKPTKQVHIESKIVQVNRDFLQELGIQWGFTGSSFRNPQFPNVIQFSGAARGTGALSAPVQAGGVNLQGGPSVIGSNIADRTSALTAARIDPGFIVDLATVGSPLGAIATSLLSLSGDLELDLQLSALERQGKSKTIASPKVTALDNKEATIRSGTRLPYQTTDPSSGTKIQFIDALIELKVTPHVTTENMVYMKVSATQNVPDPVRNVGGIPVILTKEAVTELLVSNRDTAVLGGLFQKTISDNTRAVPYVSEIPIVGNLFKSKAKADNVSELLIFIQPTVVMGM